MSAPAPTMKPWIDAIHPYVAGKAKLGDTPIVAKLSSNENPFGPSPKAIEAMTAVLADAGRYPDPASTALRAALGAKHGVDPDRIICGTGSDELLHLVAGAFAGEGVSHFRAVVRRGDGDESLAARRTGCSGVHSKSGHDQSTIDINGLARDICSII